MVQIWIWINIDNDNEDPLWGSMINKRNLNVKLLRLAVAVGHFSGILAYDGVYRFMKYNFAPILSQILVLWHKKMFC